ncbi:hypothetical protein B0H13DRAFT_84852 [Mycena leptocephala]|nr:hypothetical protein B0H13DRAFT_84852 [Mycena leptocephala]
MLLCLQTLRNELDTTNISAQRRAEIQAELDLYTYPVLTLPHEITSEIFLQSLPSTLDFDVVPNPSEAPLVLLQICRSWRTVALSTPRLWCGLDLDVRDHPKLWAPEKYEEFINTWFDRARTLPLSLSLCEPEPRQSRDYDSMNVTLFLRAHFLTQFPVPSLDTINALLRRHASHLRSLALCLTEDSFVGLHSGTSFPILEDLYLSCYYDVRFRPCKDTFRRAPRLRSLSLFGIEPTQLTVPWEQLTKFVAENIGIEQCLRLLEKNPRLRELAYSASRQPCRPPISPLTLSGLVSLELYNDGRIMPFLELPNLEKLSVSNVTHRVEPIPFPLISSTSLRTFEFGKTTPTVTLEWVRHMEHLTTLELCSSTWDYMDDLFRALNRASEPQFLPKLESIVLSEFDSDDLDADLLKALDSRSTPADDGCTTLESFRLVWPNDTIRTRSSLPVDKLDKLVVRGMKIHVGTQDKNYF